MKPEWPLYGLGVVAGTVIGVSAAIFDWSDQTVSWVAAATIAVTLWTYLPRIDRRSDRRGPKARSARS
jgi:hypothetical protein